MPLVKGNPFMPGNVVWKCAKCGDVFVFVDVGEKHEKRCDGTSQQKVSSGQRKDQIKTGEKK